MESKSSKLLVVSSGNQRRVCCPFDSYECFRNLCCHSRFYYPFRCSRFVVTTHYRYTYPSVKVDLQLRSRF